MNRIRQTFPALLVVLLSASFFAAPLRADEDSELNKQMEILSKSLKGLKKSLRDPAATAESMKLVYEAQLSALASKELPPSMLAKAPEAERPKLMMGYRKMMGNTVVVLLKLEEQIIDGKLEDAQETLKELKDLEDKGHEKYNP